MIAILLKCSLRRVVRGVHRTGPSEVLGRPHLGLHAGQKVGQSRLILLLLTG